MIAEGEEFERQQQGNTHADYANKIISGKHYTQMTFDQTKMEIERKKPRHEIRKSLLVNLDNLDESKHKQVKKFIFQNHEITQAAASFESI